MKKKKTILLVVLLIAVGFAAVSTTLYINGSTNINTNQADFNVYYSDAYVNGTQDKSVITDNIHIAFTTELSALGEKYVLDYEVTNGSKNYDAELEMVCTGGNDYLSVTNDFDDESILKAKALREGKLTLELTKSYAGDEDLEVTIECTINANALERESLGIENRSEIGVTAIDENDKDLNAKAYEITGDDETELLDLLEESGLMDDTSEIDALIEVDSDDFDNLATTTFDVSSIAEEGDKVVILHFDEEKQEWEYIAEETVDENGKVTADFSSYSPVAFVVIKNESYEIVHDYNEDHICNLCGKYIGDGGYYSNTGFITTSGLSATSLSKNYTTIYNQSTKENVYIISTSDYGTNIPSNVINGITGINLGNNRYSVTVNASATTVLIVPKNTTTVGNGALVGGPNLRTILLPDSIKYIGKSFYDEPNLKKVAYMGVVYENRADLVAALEANGVTVANIAFSDLA